MDDCVTKVDVFNMLDRLKPTATRLDALSACFLKSLSRFSRIHSQLYPISQLLRVLCVRYRRRRSSYQYLMFPHQTAKLITAQYLLLQSCHVWLRDVSSQPLPTSTGGWIAKWVVSSVRVPKGPGTIAGGAKVLDTDGICKYLPVSVLSDLEVCLCLLCSVCIN